MRHLLEGGAYSGVSVNGAVLIRQNTVVQNFRTFLCNFRGAITDTEFPE